jgi:tetratricopeptide (TPR) repeat protein
MPDNTSRSCREFIQYIDGLIRSGQSAKARSELSRHRPSSFTREERFELAAVARRAALPWLTIRLLTPLVRPPAKKNVQATTKEKAEYAAALVRVGASREAADALRELDANEFPQVLLYRAHALFTQWEYAQSIPVLQEYLEKNLSEYQRTVGEINLASAYVHERNYEQAETLLEKLERDTQRENLPALYGNTLERLAELAIDRKNWTLADHHLAKAEKAVEQAAGFDAFFVLKWRSVLNLSRNPRRGVADFEKFKLLAEEKKHWETVRECDTFRAVVCNERDLFLKVYFGTPYLSYRERLRRDFKDSIEIPDSLALAIPSMNARTAATEKLDLLRNGGLKSGQLKHRLLKAMISDFYRPARVAHLFSDLYTDERFELVGSRARVHVAMQELRNWFRKKRLPLRIVETQGEFRLTSSVSGLQLIVPSPQWWQQNPDNRLARARVHAGTDVFSAEEFARWLKIPRRTAFEILSNSLSNGLVKKTGAGPTTRYQFTISKSDLA